MTATPLAPVGEPGKAGELVRQLRTRFAVNPLIYDTDGAAADMIDALQRKLEAGSKSEGAPVGGAEHALAMAIIDLANIAYQHGREELSPWPEQWQKLERRILSLALWGAKGASPDLREAP